MTMNILTNITDGYTLKMFADATNKQHRNIKRDFNKMIDSLSEAENHLLNYEQVVFESKGKQLTEEKENENNNQ